MKSAMILCGTVAAVLLTSMTVKAGDCRYAPVQAVVVQEVQPVYVQKVVTYSAPQAVIVQRQVANYGYTQAFSQRQVIRQRQSVGLGGGLGLGGIINRQNILTGVGAAAGAALFGPFGAAGGAVLGGIIGGGN